MDPRSPPFAVVSTPEVAATAGTDVGCADGRTEGGPRGAVAGSVPRSGVMGAGMPDGRFASDAAETGFSGAVALLDNARMVIRDAVSTAGGGDGGDGFTVGAAPTLCKTEDTKEVPLCHLLDVAAAWGAEGDGVFVTGVEGIMGASAFEDEAGAPFVLASDRTR